MPRARPGRSRGCAATRGSCRCLRPFAAWSELLAGAWQGVAAVLVAAALRRHVRPVAARRGPLSRRLRAGRPAAVRPAALSPATGRIFLGPPLCGAGSRRARLATGGRFRPILPVAVALAFPPGGASYLLGAAPGGGRGGAASDFARVFTGKYENRKGEHVLPIQARVA